MTHNSLDFPVFITLTIATAFILSAAASNLVMALLTLGWGVFGLVRYGQIYPKNLGNPKNYSLPSRVIFGFYQTKENSKNTALFNIFNHGFLYVFMLGLVYFIASFIDKEFYNIAEILRYVCAFISLGFLFLLGRLYSAHETFRRYSYYIFLTLILLCSLWIIFQTPLTGQSFFDLQIKQGGWVGTYGVYFIFLPLLYDFIFDFKNNKEKNKITRLKPLCFIALFIMAALFNIFYMASALIIFVQIMIVAQLSLYKF